MINLGNANIGPRAAGYSCDSMEDVLELPAIDFGKGRIHEVLKACRELRARGYHVVLDVSGPFTVLNCLVDAPKVFKALRKKPDIAYQVMWRLGEEAIAFMKEAKKYGVQMISYADSSGAVSILGPKVAEQVVENFTYEFMKRVQSEVCDENTLVIMCPKTAFALIGCDRAEFRKYELSGPMKYAEACIEVIGKTSFAGQTCIKNVEYSLSGGVMHVLELK